MRLVIRKDESSGMSDDLKTVDKVNLRQKF